MAAMPRRRGDVRRRIGGSAAGEVARARLAGRKLANLISIDVVLDLSNVGYARRAHNMGKPGGSCGVAILGNDFAG